MCGILGYTGKSDFTSTDRLLGWIEHRGRDDRSIAFVEGVNLGMNRLAINDLRTGLYPIRYKQYYLIFNGEIYNYPLLLKELTGQGIVLNGKCDADVILPLYDLYGAKAFSLLEGMFAVAIMDVQKKMLILARDKAGEKNLYYARTKNGLVFASELKVLLQSGLVKKHIHMRALVNYLHHGSVWGKETLVKNVYKLEPSEWIVFKLKTKELQHNFYWDPLGNQVLLSEGEEGRVACLDSLLHEAVKSRMWADVKIGAFLSGGVDSSLIAVLASEYVKHLRTYSVAFPDSPWYDESAHSAKVAKLLGSEHTIIECTAAAARPVMERIGELIDEPILDPAVLPTFLLSRSARQDLKAVVTGEGSDELFGGYYRYHKHLMANKSRTILVRLGGLDTLLQRVFPERFRWLAERLDETYSPLHTWELDELNQLLRTRVKGLSRGAVREELWTNNPLLAMQITDLRGYLAAQVLFKTDKFTMTNNLEGRAPFLDTKVMEFAFSLTEREKIRGIHGKYLLKKVAEKYLPKDIVWRAKRGFSLPLGKWFREDYQDIVQDGVRALRQFEPIFRLDIYDQLLKKHNRMSGEDDFRDKIWSMTVLGLWLKHYQIQL